MSQKLSVIWWNTSLSPPTSQRSSTDKKLTEIELKEKKNQKIDLCISVIQKFLDLDYDFICLGEINTNDLNNIIKKLNLETENYTYIDSYQKVGQLHFDTAILYKNKHLIKPMLLDDEAFYYENLIYSNTDRNCKTGQKFRFYLPEFEENLILYLVHWSSKQSTDDSLYDSIAQDLRSSIGQNESSKDNLMIIGDFNIEPHHSAIVKKLQSSREKALVVDRKGLLYNPCWKFLSHSQTSQEDKFLGTYKLRKTGYQNDWHMIDQVLISKNFLKLKGDWAFRDQYVKIIDTKILLGLTQNISDHFAISILIPRTLK